MLFQLAILIVIIIAAIALIRLVLPSLGVSIGPPFDQVIRILVWAVVTIMIIVFIWKLAECSGLMRLGNLTGALT
jgi:hypothetical protein